MQNRTLFLLNTLVALPFGVGSLLAPRLLLSLFGAELEPAGALMMQFGGAWLIGLGLLTWFARDVARQAEQRRLASAFLVMYVAGTVVALLGQIAGALNALGWFVVAINAFLAMGFGYALIAGAEAGAPTPLAQG